jgi:ketosteroid isomerase-like protein
MRTVEQGNSRTPSEDEVLSAAQAIVKAFGATDTENYFAGFAPDATFVFHSEQARLNSRLEYEQKWQGWLADGWRVVECQSSDELVQCFPGGSVFSHTVHTTVDTKGERDAYVERESIVFRVAGDKLVAIHEHLSSPTGEQL